MDEKKENYRDAKCCASCKLSANNPIVWGIVHCDYLKEPVSVIRICDSYEPVGQ